MGEKKKDLTQKVIDEIKVNVESYNSISDVTERNNRIQHHNVCNDLFRYSVASGFPITILVYIAVSTEGHRACVFDKGYHAFYRDKADRIVRWCKELAKYFGHEDEDGFLHNANLVHTLCRYANQGHSCKQFKECYKRLDTFDPRSFKNAKELQNVLFGGALTFNDKGYFVKTK